MQFTQTPNIPHPLRPTLNRMIKPLHVAYICMKHGGGEKLPTKLKLSYDKICLTNTNYIATNSSLNQLIQFI